MKIKLRKLEATLVFLTKSTLYIILFWLFYGIYAKSNWWLLNLSRTSGVTIATYVTMNYMFSNIYGRFDIGKRKTKPIIYSMVLSTAFTDIISLFINVPVCMTIIHIVG